METCNRCCQGAIGCTPQHYVHALRKADGTWVNGNYARYYAYGGYRTTPATTVNPGISDRGYTGHRMNNTGNDLDLIYMNARYYLPEVGRFIRADTIVPDSRQKAWEVNTGLRD